MEREELEAHLAVLDLEEQLRAQKENGDLDRDLKLRLREARRVHRTLREGGDPDEGVARPAAIDTAGEVQ